MIGFANAKINLGLFVTEKRIDGFHNLETVFFPIGVHDVIEFIVSDSTPTHLKSQGIVVPGDQSDNLILQAYQLLARDFALPALEFGLIKNIPIGAGLGGGSSDAARVLCMLNDKFDLHIDQKKLVHYASQLGSDCAFFILNQPSFATGRGEVLTPIDLSLKGYYLLLIHPGIHVSTKDAFAKIKPKNPSFDLRELITLPIQDWKNCVYNDFEESVFEIHHEIRNIKNQLYHMGAIYASMSGSGSAVYGIFQKTPSINDWPNHYFVKRINF